MDPSRLGPAQRSADLERAASETFDLVVIGGGVVGAGTALDAASRGLSVCLVEQRDWASGTSSRSSKLIHGGLRYLEQLDFSLVREALREQTLMLERLCPHLVRPIPFLYPLRRRVWERGYIGAGTLLYDTLAGRRALPRHRHLSRRGVLARFPGLRGDRLVGGIQYWDAQVDDARHTLALVRTARVHGAVTLSSARVEDLRMSGTRVSGVSAVCLETGRNLEIEARQVVNATGVWTDAVQNHAGRGRIHVRASKGIHLVVPRDRIHGDSGLILRTEKSVLFVIPWDAHWIIGTTDSDWNLDLAHPAASRSDIDYLLERVNAVLAQPLRHEDIEGVYAGLRPLLQGESDATSQLSREHAVSQSVSGLITVAGGKYTTYRVMAKDVVDVAARGIDRRVPPSCTHEIPLIGAAGYRAHWNRRDALASRSGLHVHVIEHLLQRYGSRSHELLDLVRDDHALGEPLEGAPGYLAVEIHYAASHEGALHLDDVLTRRTRISIETFDRGIVAARATARIMATILDWDEETVTREIEHYDARVRAERESQTQPDDRTADAARMGAPDVRIGKQIQERAPVVVLDDHRRAD
ncbi:MAG: glycerol-3-phosphate dehydrogenase/oxidase [Deltaproteobacteria bacterium]|jgi:glycerol-3-phosphate dehydrogenase|nr:glycerol-3-phosphate dehydrogenase/oxidase [Deltaproteobacteria bacterium]